MKEASQVWLSVAKYIPTVAETAWKSINPAAMLLPLSPATMAAFSDMSLLRLSEQGSVTRLLSPQHPGQAVLRTVGVWKW